MTLKQDSAFFFVSFQFGTYISTNLEVNGNLMTYDFSLQSERLAQERKVLNWEKLFSKVMVNI